ncbi:MAG: pitrilysin family protein, partial [Proteobacteria bacterium]|nr:pitrilysin family protein [Pseudomonadota bacterium]
FISAKCPSGKLIELFALVNDLLFHAEFKEPDMERFKEELFAALMQSMQSPEAQLNELIKETVYKHHPYGIPNKVYLESLKSITAADLKKFVKSMFTQENLIVSACGDFDEKNLSEQLAIFIDTLPKKFKAELPKNISVEGPYEIHHTKFPVPQTVLKFLHKGVDHDHPDFFALQVAVGCLSDPFVGLLFKKLRVEKALVYGIGAGLAIQDHFNAFGVSTFTQTENVEKVIDSVKEVFEDVCKNGFSPELVENIKQGFVGSYKRSFSSSGHIARRLANYQLTDRPVDYHKVLIEKIEALTPEQISEAFKKFLNPNQFIIFTVGQ